MNVVSILRNSLFSIRQTFSPRNKSLLVPPCSSLIQRDGILTLKHTRNYGVNQNIQNNDTKQPKRGLKIVKYVAGFIGTCVLAAAVGARLYKRVKYRLKGLETVKSRHYSRKNPAYLYRGYILPLFAADKIDEINSFKVRKDDVWIVGFPKSGTTWLAEIVFLINTDVDFEGVKSKIEDRFPYFEYFYPGLTVIENTPSPRCMKTHLPFSLLPADYEEKKPKTFYIARNPKDTLVSFHFFLQEFFVKSMWHFTLSFDDYCQLFLDDQVHYGPWWRHVIEGWEKRNDDNVLYITYEEMNMDLHGSIKKIAAFLGKKLSVEDVEAIACHCSFNEMRENKFVNYSWLKDCGVANKDAHFLRKGKIGDWKNHLSKDQEIKLDHMVATKLEPVGLKFIDSPPKSDGD